MLVPERGNGSSDKSNSSGSGEKWGDAGTSGSTGLCGPGGEGKRGVQGASSGSGLLPGRMGLPFSEMRMRGQGREADPQGKIERSALDLGV